MAVNPNIPLQAQTLDLASPLATLIQSRERNEDRQMMRRQEQRQQDQFDLSNQQTRQAIQTNAAQLRQVMNSQATQDYVTDALTVRNLISNNDTQNAGVLMQSMLEKYKGTPYAQGLDVDLQNLQSGNIEPVLRSIDDDLTMVQQVRQVLSGQSAQRDPVRLGQGEILVDPVTGRGIAQGLPPREQRDTVRESRISNIAQQLQSQMGMNPQQAMTEAANIADGNIRYEVLESGQVRRIDQVSGQVSEVAVSNQQAQIPAPQQGRTLFELANQATGPVSAARAGLARIGVADPAVLEARTELRNSMQELSKALVVNDRFPVAEVERVRRDTDLDPAIIDNPAAMQARMRGLESYLSRRQAQAERDANDPALPQSVRDGQAANASSIRNFRAVMGVPAQISSDFLGTPEAVQGVDVNSLKYFIENADDDDLNALSDDVVNAIIQKVSGR